MSTLHEAIFHSSANLGLLGMAICDWLLLTLIQLGWTLGSLIPQFLFYFFDSISGL